MSHHNPKKSIVALLSRHYHHHVHSPKYPPGFAKPFRIGGLAINFPRKMLGFVSLRCTLESAGKSFTALLASWKLKVGPMWRSQIYPNLPHFLQNGQGHREQQQNTPTHFWYKLLKARYKFPLLKASHRATIARLT